MCVCVLRHVWLFATPWTVAHQASLCMKFSGQEYWSKLPFLPLGDLPHPGIKPLSPALASRFLTTEPPWKPHQKRSDWVKCIFRVQFHKGRTEVRQSRAGAAKPRVLKGLGEGLVWAVSHGAAAWGERRSWAFSSTKAKVCVCVCAWGCMWVCVVAKHDSWLIRWLLVSCRQGDLASLLWCGLEGDQNTISFFCPLY